MQVTSCRQRRVHRDQPAAEPRGRQHRQPNGPHRRTSRTRPLRRGPVGVGRRSSCRAPSGCRSRTAAPVEPGSRRLRPGSAWSGARVRLQQALARESLDQLGPRRCRDHVEVPAGTAHCSGDRPDRSSSPELGYEPVDRIPDGGIDCGGMAGPGHVRSSDRLQGRDIGHLRVHSTAGVRDRGVVPVLGRPSDRRDGRVGGAGRPERLCRGGVGLRATRRGRSTLPVAVAPAQA